MKKAILATVFLLLAVLCCVIPANAEMTGPVIATQPQDVSVNYPDSTSFTVVPDDPGEVASYQWYFIDSVGQTFKLDGTSAVTDTLIFPATDQYMDGCAVYCILTGTNGQTTRTRSAEINILNSRTERSIVYLSDHAILPGETLDLSTTELGSGKVTYSADRTQIILDNVYFDNTTVILDHTVPSAIGLTLNDYDTDISHLDIVLKGSNIMRNTLYDENVNGSGITLDLYFFAKATGTAPAVTVTGDGDLTLFGGTIQLRTNGDLNLNAPIKFLRNGEYFCDGANGYNVSVGENIPLTFDVNGTLIFANNSMLLQKGVVIDAKTSAPHVGGDYTMKNGFLCGGNLFLDHARVKITLDADPDRFLPYELAVGSFMGINAHGKLFLTDSTVEITQTAKAADQAYFEVGGGISCRQLEAKNSRISVKVDSNAIGSANGIRVAEDACITDSTVTCGVRTAGRTFGIAVTNDLTVKDSTVTVDCASASDEAYGIMYKSALFDLNEAAQTVSSRVNKGFAMGAQLGNGTEILPFDPDYKVTATKLGAQTEFRTPTDAVLNQASMNQSRPGRYVYLETPFSDGDHRTAATCVVIGSNAPVPTPAPAPIPETGDVQHPALWLTLLILSGLCALPLLKKRYL